MKYSSLDLKLKNKLKILLKNVNKDTNTSKIISSLYDIATQDEKTQLYNYRFFNSIFNIELEKAKRGAHLSLAILDLDYFKKINTKYGYSKADKILYSVARILEKSIRKSDTLARFGGEEFIILFPGTKLENAKLVCERIRKRTEIKMKKFSVTISIGVAEYKNNSIKREAEINLQKAKDLGRNRVV